MRLNGRDDLARYMHWLKEQRGYTFDYLSRKTGIPEGTIKGYFLGGMNIPIDRAVKIMGCFGYKLVFKKRGIEDAGEPE